MLSLTLFLASLFIQPFLSDECTVPKGLLDPGTIEACINSVTFTNASEEIAAVKLTMDELLKGYCFRDAALNLPENYKPYNVDFLGEINALTANDGDRVYDFYRSILDITDRVHDSHFNFRVPCVQNFYYELPYQFNVHTTTLNNGESELTLYITSTNETSEIPTGSKVVHLKLGDEEDIEGENPVQTVARWAHHHIGNIRSPMGRLTYAIASTFAHRTPTMGLSPDPIEITYENAETGEEETKTVAFLEYASAAKADKDDLCGLRPADEKMNTKKEEKKEEEKKKTLRRQEDTPFHEDRRMYEQYLADTNQTESAEKARNAAISAQLQKMIRSSRKTDWIDEEPQVFDSKQLAVGYVYTKNKIGVFQLPSYMYLYEEHIAVCEALIDTVVAAKEADVEKFFFINLLNGGGSATLMDFVRDLFWPNQFPVAYSSDMPISNFARFISDNHSPEEPSVTIDFDTLDEKHILDRLPYVNLTFTGTFNNSVVSRTYPYSRRFRFIFYEDEKSAHKKIPDNLRRQPPFTPQQLVFVTDYFCVSACAFTLKWAQENRFAKVVGLGADLYNPDHVLSDASNSPSGPVVQISDLYELAEEQHVEPDLPPRFPRLTTDCRITFGATYSVQPTPDGEVSYAENMTMNEFKVFPPDYNLPIVPPPSASQREDYLRYIVQQALPVVDTCVEWEVAANSTDECANGPSYGHKIAHALYGHPCNTRTGLFDTESCVFFRCNYNYHLTKDGKCVLNPRNTYRDYPDDIFSGDGEEEEDDDDSSWDYKWTTIVILASFSFILIICFIIALCCLLPRRGEFQSIKDSPSSYQNAPVNP